MIVLTRANHRLSHGQVVLPWTQTVGADCISIANDDVPTSEVRKTTVKLAKPQGVEPVVKSVDDSTAALESGVTNKYKLFIVAESIEDAHKLTETCPEIKTINLGGIKVRPGTRSIGRVINVLPEEEEHLKRLVDK